MNKDNVLALAHKIIAVGEGQDKAEFIAALQAAAAGAIYHSYLPSNRWNGVTEFCVAALLMKELEKRGYGDEQCRAYRKLLEKAVSFTEWQHGNG